MFEHEGEFNQLKQRFSEQQAQSDALRHENSRNLGECPVASCHERIGNFTRAAIFSHFKDNHSNESSSFSCPLRRDGALCNVKITADRVQEHYQHIGDTAVGPRRRGLGINIQDMYTELVETNSNVVESGGIIKDLLFHAGEESPTSKRRRAENESGYRTNLRTTRGGVSLDESRFQHRSNSSDSDMKPPGFGGNRYGSASGGYRGSGDGGSSYSSSSDSYDPRDYLERRSSEDLEEDEQGQSINIQPPPKTSRGESQDPEATGFASSPMKLAVDPYKTPDERASIERDDSAQEQGGANSLRVTRSTTRRLASGSAVVQPRVTGKRDRSKKVIEEGEETEKTSVKRTRRK